MGDNNLSLLEEECQHRNNFSILFTRVSVLRRGEEVEFAFCSFSSFLSYQSLIVAQTGRHSP